MISQTHNQDCVAGMRDWPDKHFGLGESDPPYFSGPENKKFYGHTISPINVKRVDYTPLNNWSLPTDDFFTELYRVSDDQIIWGANYYPQIGLVHSTPRGEELKQWISEHPTGWIVWDKCQTNPSFNDYELAWTSFNRPTIVYTYMWSGMLQGKSMLEGNVMQGNKRLNEKRIHQTQKPMPLYQWQYLNYADRSKPILDTHLGSQSSRIVAHKMGFDFVGYEIEEHVFNSGNQRFKELTRLPLFDSI